MGMNQRKSLLCIIFCAWVVGFTSTMLQADLVAHFTMDGFLEDEVDGLEATYYETLAPYDDYDVEAGYDGTEDGAILFDAAFGHLVEIPVAEADALPIYNGKVYTVAMWVKGDATTQQGDRRVYSESSSTSDRPLLNIGTHFQAANGAVDIYIRGVGGEAIRHKHSQGTAFDGTWHHIAWVDDGGNAVLYIDGVRDGTDFTYNQVPDLFDISSIGGIIRPTTGANHSHQFTGAIDDVRLYDHALTEEEVAELVIGNQECPEEGDTHCGSLELTAGPDDNSIGDYTFTVEDSVDDSGDPIVYTFTAVNEEGETVTMGPSAANAATMRLGFGTWTVTAFADDFPLCDDEAPDATCVDLEVVVELGKNVALGGTPSQSSDYGNGQFPASFAIDGNLGNFTHTLANDNFPDNSWWEIELNQDYPLESIQIHNRDNCCGSRMRDIVVLILDEAREIVYESEILNEENELGFELNGNKYPLGPEMLEVLLDDPVVGRFVRIERIPDDDASGSDGQGNADESTVLSLGEVIINRSTDIIEPQITFRRGDTDGNGVLEITDPINSLSFQFLGKFTPPCADAADFDDNGKIEITDPIASLSHQFLGTTPPAPPGAENCGQDPTPDDPELGCEIPHEC